VVCAEGKTEVQVKDDFMNGRSGVFKFFLFLFLGVIILLQFLSMIQADRLYDRLNTLIGRLESHASVPTRHAEKPTSSATSAKEYPGDEGDWLVWSINAEPETLNPLTSRDIYAQWIVGTYYFSNIFEGLLNYDFDTLKLKPLLAESYEISKDALQITMRIRSDVHFSDGHPITADDITFSYKTIMDPNVDAAQLRNYYNNLKEVVKIDGRTVKFIFDKPYFKSLEIVGDIPILPEHLYKFTDASQFNNRRSNPVGSGPYVFERWDMGREIVLTRNENYWGAKPHIKKIVFRIITNEVAELQALRSHETDFMRPRSEQYAGVSADGQFVKEFKCLSFWIPQEGYTYIGWNQDLSFFKERKVRLAMTHLVDREEINKHLLKGLGRIVTGPFYILGPQYDPNIQPWPYDPNKARQLLDEAGWIDHDGDGIRDKNGTPFKFKFMTVSGSPLYEQLARLLKDSFAQVGIDLNPDPYEWSVFSERLHTRAFEAVTLSWGGTVQDDPYQIWHSSQIGNRGSNYVGFRNAKADAIIEEARATMDEEKRNEFYHQLDRILHEEQPYTFLFTRPSLELLDNRFENVVVHKLGLNPHEWYVPKDKQRYK
jgi:peptide/nickel transport system substrate-binding protein